MFAGSSPITFTSPSSEACQKVRALCSAGITRPRRSYDPVRLPPWPLPSATLRTLPSPMTGLPRLPEPPFRRAVPTTPADRAGARVDCFPARAAFPKWQEGRHPHCHFRGLHQASLCYGPPDRSATQGDLCHEAPTQPVTRPSRSSASGPIDNYPGGILLHWCFAPSGRTASFRHSAGPQKAASKSGTNRFFIGYYQNGWARAPTLSEH